MENSRSNICAQGRKQALKSKLESWFVEATRMDELSKGERTENKQKAEK